MANLGEVLKNLESAKVTERQEGLSGIRTAFSKPLFLRTFHLHEDGQTEDRNWILVFNALFTMVRLEKAEYAKSLTKRTQPKPAVVKRLTDAANTIRWLVESAVAYLGKDAMGQVLHHLRDEIVLRMEILTPIALDYAKAIKCILGFKPHLEHISDGDWNRLLALAFNVVLRDSPRTILEDDMDWESESGDESTVLPGKREEEEEEEEEEENEWFESFLPWYVYDAMKENKRFESMRVRPLPLVRRHLSSYPLRAVNKKTQKSSSGFISTRSKKNYSTSKIP